MEKQALAKSKTSSRAAVQPGTWRPVEAMAAWIFPGLGHFLSGEKARGIVLAVTIMLLWTAGLLIGGPTVLDRLEPPEANDPPRRSISMWYFGQVLMAPGMLFEMGQSRLRGGQRQLVPEMHEPFEPSFGRTFEQGQLYTALAGLLNLLAIIDVAYVKPRRDEGKEQAEQKGSSSAVSPKPQDGGGDDK